jgi:hypothetical protein
MNFNLILDEPNWEEQRLAIVNVGRMPGVRHQIIQRDQSSEESSDNEDNPNNQNFDTQLPTQHSVSAYFKVILMVYTKGQLILKANFKLFI